MERLKKYCVLLFLGIINNLSFAQEKEIVVSYITGLTTIIFYNDSTFWYKRGPHALVSYDYKINDTLNYGTYIKEKKHYILTSTLVKDSVEEVSIISKKKIVLNDILFLEWKYYHKKTKQQDSPRQRRKINKKYNRHMLKYGTPPKPPRWQRAVK
ncbi:MAG: hypothetical protein GX330_07145 [Bacteroidales bacterium]|nr:hypothetical protein [Bacteroidales bacterium]